LDGEAATTSLQDRLLTISVPAGKHVVAFSYQRVLLTVFLALYGAYAGLLLLLLAGHHGRSVHWAEAQAEICLGSVTA